MRSLGGEQINCVECTVYWIWGNVTHLDGDRVFRKIRTDMFTPGEEEKMEWGGSGAIHHKPPRLTPTSSLQKCNHAALGSDVVFPRKVMLLAGCRDVEPNHLCSNKHLQLHVTLENEGRLSWRLRRRQSWGPVTASSTGPPVQGKKKVKTFSVFIVIVVKQTTKRCNIWGLFYPLPTQGSSDGKVKPSITDILHQYFMVLLCLRVFFSERQIITTPYQSPK